MENLQLQPQVEQQSLFKFLVPLSVLQTI